MQQPPHRQHTQTTIMKRKRPTLKETQAMQQLPSEVAKAIQYLEMRRLRHDDYDPTPQFLYDDTNGEPPISWQERRDAEFRKKYGWA